MEKGKRIYGNELSVTSWCLVGALSDYNIVPSYSDGELLLTRFHNYFLFPF